MSAGICAALAFGCDGAFAWLDDPGMARSSSDYIEDSLVTNVIARHERLGVELQLNDGIHQRECIYMKRVVVRNLGDTPKDVRVFFHHDLMIDGNEVGDTAAFYPTTNVVPLQAFLLFYVQRALGSGRHLSIFDGHQKIPFRGRDVAGCRGWRTDGQLDRPRLGRQHDQLSYDSSCRATKERSTTGCRSVPTGRG